MFNGFEGAYMDDSDSFGNFGLSGSSSVPLPSSSTAPPNSTTQQESTFAFPPTAFHELDGSMTVPMPMQDYNPFAFDQTAYSAYGYGGQGGALASGSGGNGQTSEMMASGGNSTGVGGQADGYGRSEAGIAGTHPQHHFTFSVPSSSSTAYRAQAHGHIQPHVQLPAHTQGQPHVHSQSHVRPDSSGRGHPVPGVINSSDTRSTLTRTSGSNTSTSSTSSSALAQPAARQFGSAGSASASRDQQLQQQQEHRPHHTHGHHQLGHLPQHRSGVPESGATSSSQPGVQHQQVQAHRNPERAQSSGMTGGVGGFGMGFGNGFGQTQTQTPGHDAPSWSGNSPAYGQHQAAMGMMGLGGAGGMNYTPYDWATDGSNAGWMDPSSYGAYGVGEASGMAVGMMSGYGHNQHEFAAGGQGVAQHSYAMPSQASSGVDASTGWGQSSLNQHQQEPQWSPAHVSLNGQGQHQQPSSSRAQDSSTDSGGPRLPRRHTDDSQITGGSVAQEYTERRRHSAGEHATGGYIEDHPHPHSHAGFPFTAVGPSSAHYPDTFPPLTQQHQRQASFPPSSHADSSSLSGALSSPAQPSRVDVRFNEAQFAQAMNLNRREALHAVECARQEMGGVPSRDIPEDVCEALARQDSQDSSTECPSDATVTGVGEAASVTAIERQFVVRELSQRSPTTQDASSEVHPSMAASSSAAPTPQFPSQASSSSKVTPVTHGAAFPTATAVHTSPPAPNPVPSGFIIANPHLTQYIGYDGHIDYQVGGYGNEVYDGRSYIPDDANVPQAPPGARSGDDPSIPKPHPLNPDHGYHMLLNPTGPVGDFTGRGGAKGSGGGQRKPLTTDRKPPPKMACMFCRARKIACGVGTGEDKTCNQCLRRNQKCVFPTESRRGIRNRKKKASPDAANPESPTQDDAASGAEHDTNRKGKGKARSGEEEEEEDDEVIDDGDDNHDEDASHPGPSSLTMPPPLTLPVTPSQSPSGSYVTGSPTTYASPDPSFPRPSRINANDIHGSSSSFNEPGSSRAHSMRPPPPPSQVATRGQVRRGPFTTSPLARKKQKRDDGYLERK